MDIPQRDRIGRGRVIEPRHAGDPLGHLALRIARGPQPTQVTLDVRGKYRHAGITEGLGQALQGDRFPGTCGTGHQAVAICQAHRLGNRLPLQVCTDNELQ
ncbi:hypothetical protein D3C76_1406040 [compost metagenome]